MASIGQPSLPMDPGLHHKILDILERHRVMTVATLRPDGWPQATTVGYVNDGLTLYFLCAPQSQKARNLALDDRVSLTVDEDTADLMGITGVSMAARARRVEDPAAVELFLQRTAARYPEYREWPMPRPRPEDVCVFRVDPEVISVLDYTKGFGHAELVRVEGAGGAAPPG